MTQVMCIQPPRRERRRGGRGKEGGIERESEGGVGERKGERERVKEGWEGGRGKRRPGMRQVKEKEVCKGMIIFPCVLCGVDFGIFASILSVQVLAVCVC